MSQHKERLAQRVLKPLQDSNLFDNFTTAECTTQITTKVTDFVRYLQTLSHYIDMPADESHHFFDVVEKTLREKCGGEVPTTLVVSILNMATRT